MNYAVLTLDHVASVALVYSEDDNVGVDRESDTDKRKDSARSIVEHADSLDEHD